MHPMLVGMDAGDSVEAVSMPDPEDGEAEESLIATRIGGKYKRRGAA